MVDDTFPPLRTLLRAFPGMPIDEARKLTRSGTVKAYPAEAVLCVEDSFEDTFYILLNGRVRVTKKVDPAGGEVRLLKVLQPGDFFGEMALIQEAPRAATVTTEVPTSVLEIYRDVFDDLLSDSPSLSRALMLEAVKRLRENDQMAIEDLRLKAGELALAYQRLAEQEYARSQFLTTLAHELRTPLTAARGFLSLIEMHLGRAGGTQAMVEGGPETVSEAAAGASRHLEQIIALVNDLLFVQEMDLILPQFAPVDLEEAVRAALAGSAQRRRENPVAVQIQAAPDLPRVAGDAASLRRAAAALLDNAIKFSHPGGLVVVRLEPVGQAVRLTMCDTGVGIPPEALPHVFERFYHVDRIGDRLFRGAGLGLSIARQVIEQHYGSIRIESRLGEGTTVTVDLPIYQKEIG